MRQAQKTSKIAVSRRRAKKKSAPKQAVPVLRPGAPTPLARLATPAERERCRVLSWHQERVAARYPAVRLLRRRLFGDERKTITPEQAFDALESEALRYLGRDFFVQRDIPFAGHRSEVRPHPRVATDGAGEPIAQFEDYKATVWWRGKEASQEGTVTIAEESGVHPVPRTVLVPRRGGLRSVICYRGSWLDQIAAFCEGIRLDFMWSEPDAILFVLTGVAPAVEPVSASVEVATPGVPLRAEVVLRFQPFVSARTIRKAAKMASLSVRLSLRGKSKGRLGRPVKERTLAVFQFVEEAWEKEKGVPWADLVARWDRLQRKEWSYRGNRVHMHGDYVRARRYITESAHDLVPALAPASEVTVSFGTRDEGTRG